MGALRQLPPSRSGPQTAGRSASDAPAGLCVAKVLPVDAKLVDGRTQDPDLQVTPALVGQYGISLNLAIEPPAVCPAASAVHLVAAERSQFASSVPVPHGMATSASTETGPSVSSTQTFGGSGRPRPS